MMIAMFDPLAVYRYLCLAKEMASIYEANRSICKYVHSTSRGHEAIQLAAGLQLRPFDFVSPYYRDESMLLAMGYSPYELMLQLLTKKDDPFSGGRSYYSHPSSVSDDKPRIIHQSSATGMQVIPTTGLAQGLQYLETIESSQLRKGANGELPVVLCSLGDGSVTEGEVSEAWQVAVLKQLPIIYLVQDNDWGISVSAAEARAMDAYEYAGGFKGMKRLRVDGTDFLASYAAVQQVIADVRNERKPWLLHAKVSLLNHHTSGVRKEAYRSVEDLEMHALHDPYLRWKNHLRDQQYSQDRLQEIEGEAKTQIETDFQRAVEASEPDPSTILTHIFSDKAATIETGERSPVGNEKVPMVDAALLAVREIMEDDPHALFYGQDVGRRLGGVFREAASLAEQFGDHRVFNTAIQEAYIIGSTAGMSALGLKPIVEIQFADYIFPGINQLATELAKSCYLSNGKFPISAVIRVPTGAYGGGGPYHSASIESILLGIKGIKIAYPSNAADMKGLMKAAYLDANPVVMLEHKGLYWSKVAGTEAAKTTEPSRDYVLPLGSGRVVLEAGSEKIKSGESVCVITYGMGVYWAIAAAKAFPQQVEIIDLRTLFPLDEELVFETVRRHGKCLVLTEEQAYNSFAESLAGRISLACFRWLDAPVQVLGSLPVPAIPLNQGLEAAILPNSEKVREQLNALLSY